jgi:flagellum-specific ATP synthase
MAVHRDAQDLINIGAYKPGSNPEIDRSIKLMPRVNELLEQKVDEFQPFDVIKERVLTLDKPA